MLVVIEGTQVNVPVTSVILGMDRDDPNGYRLKMFHCVDCGNVVCQYKGHAMYVSPGGSPSFSALVVQCSNNRCRKKYLFDSVV